MKFLLVAVAVALMWDGTTSFPSRKESTLKLLHVLFRHGNRNPTGTFWDSNAFQNESYYPEGFGQLTNDGKRTEYSLGLLLRQRYNDFLGEIYNINYLDVRTTDVNRTKMSAETVLAGLYPPRQSNIWNPWLSWQPIPYNYVSTSDDYILYPFMCSAYLTTYSEVYSSSEIQELLVAKYSDMMEIISANTGISTTDFSSATGYQDVMKIQSELGFPQEAWVGQVYPQPISSLTTDMYYIMTNTTALRRTLAGAFLRKILTDTQSYINGTISPSTRKAFVYSAHDMNVGSLLLSIEAWPLSAAPPYGSTVIFEVHEIDGVYGFKLFYIDYTPGSPHPLAIPGCQHFCPIDQFYSLVEELLPVSNEYCEGS